MSHTLQVWRAVHPPARGHYWLSTLPMVHKGFLACYTASGLQQQVMAKLREIISGGGGAAGGAPWRLVCTGHSLGGALATLAAYDATREVEGMPGCRAQVGGGDARWGCRVGD